MKGFAIVALLVLLAVWAVSFARKKPKGSRGRSSASDSYNQDAATFALGNIAPASHHHHHSDSSHHGGGFDGGGHGGGDAGGGGGGGGDGGGGGH